MIYRFGTGVGDDCINRIQKKLNINKIRIDQWHSDTLCVHKDDYISVVCIYILMYNCGHVRY